MNETYVAVLFRKELLENGAYGFEPITVIEGLYDESENSFMDRTTKVHRNIKEAALVDEQEFFGFPVSLEMLKENYNTKDEKEVIEKFWQDIYALYVGISNDETNELTIYFVNPEGNLINTETEQEDSLYIGKEGIKAMLEMETVEEIKVFLNQVLKGNAIELYETQVELPQEPKIEFLKPGVNLDVKDMYEHITSKVINQDEAVRQIIMNIVEHNIAVNSKEFLSRYPNPQLTRCFITGPTGTGKTLIIESIIEYLKNNATINIPTAKGPNFKLGEDGYTIDFVDTIGELISNVTVASDIQTKIDYAEKNGIIFFDEFDKNTSVDGSEELGAAVLKAICRFAKGVTYGISGLEYENQNENSPSYYFNTKYLNIFAAGAFMDVRTAKQDIVLTGFGQESNQGLQMSDYLARNSLSQEFIESFNKIISLNSSSEEWFRELLNQSTISPILIEQAKKELMGLHLSWDDSYVTALAKKAHKLKIGAHSLKVLIEESISQAEWDFMANGGFSEVELTGKTVENPKVYTKK